MVNSTTASWKQVSNPGAARARHEVFRHRRFDDRHRLFDTLVVGSDEVGGLRPRSAEIEQVVSGAAGTLGDLRLVGELLLGWLLLGLLGPTIWKVRQHQHGAIGRRLLLAGRRAHGVRRRCRRRRDARVGDEPHTHNHQS